MPNAILRGIDMPAETLEELGYDIAAFPSDAIRTSTKMLLEYMKELKKLRHQLPERMIPMFDFLEFVGGSRRTLEDKYLPKG